LIQAALLEEVRTGRAIYHGLAGHLLLRGVPGLLRLRIIPPMEFRIRMAQDRLKLGASAAVGHIEEMDQDRRQWTQFLYGVDWGDPALYHLVINLEDATIEQACLLVISMLEQGGFEWTPECQTVVNDLALASRVRAELAVNPFTSNLEGDVKASGGRFPSGEVLSSSRRRSSAWSWRCRLEPGSTARRTGPSLGVP
jgi:hypothetical protein